MTQFKVGDRVRYIYDGEEGVVKALSSYGGAGYADVAWSDGTTMVLVEDLEPVEEQPNRTYYEPTGRLENVADIAGVEEKIRPDGSTPLNDSVEHTLRTYCGEQDSVRDYDSQKFIDEVRDFKYVPAFEQNVHRILNGVAETVVQKNVSYGDSALNPVRIFSKADRMEQLFVRLDDKLSRVQRGSEYPGDDTLRDIIGYATLILIAKESE